jgi:MipA family protein
MDRFKLSVASIGLMTLALVPMQAQAQTGGGVAIELPDIRNYVGIAAGVVPDYPGSNDYTAGIAPTALFYFSRDSEYHVRLLVTQLSLNVINNKNINAGPTVMYRFGRDDDVDDRAVKRMKEIDGGFEAGAFVTWKIISDSDPRQRLNVSLDFLQDVTGDHDGYTITPSVRYFQPLGRAFTLSVGASTTYGSDGYMSTFFSVSPSDAAVTGLNTFNAGNGFRDARVSLMGIFSFSPSWHLGLGAIYSRMLNEAADSPVTDDRGSKNQLFLGLGLAYAW